MPTNEQRRATAKRKLERQLERRAAQERRRRLFTIIGSAVVRSRRGRRAVAAYVMTQQRLRQHRHARPRPPRRPPSDARPDRPRGRGPAARRSRRPPAWATNCQYPAAAGGQQAEQAAAHRQGADRPGAGQRQHGDQPGQHRPAARQRQVAVHRQQLRQPGPAGLLQRHPMPPADHRPGLSVLQCGDPTGQRQRRSRLRVRQRIPDQPVPARRSRSCRAGALSARHARDGQRRRRAPTAASSSWCTRIRSCRPNYTVFGTIDETGLATLDKIAAAGVEGGGQDGKPADPGRQVKSIRLD